jgi:hypothetical protein
MRKEKRTELYPTFSPKTTTAPIDFHQILRLAHPMAKVSPMSSQIINLPAYLSSLVTNWLYILIYRHFQRAKFCERK